MAGITLDDLDLRILAILQDDASVSNLQLAERALSSPPTCMRRVRRLTEAGVIRRQVAVLDPVAIVRERATVGGPQPSEMDRMLKGANQRIAQQDAWIQEKRERIAASLARLDADFGRLLAGGR